jgi:hypothetical protein
MKKLIIPFIVLLCFQTSFKMKAQHGYFDNNPIWVIHEFNVPPNPECNYEGGEIYYYLKGDTTLGGHIYHKVFLKELYTTNCPPNPINYYGSNDTVHPYAYLRDTLKQIRQWQADDSILYDFNLSIGDSVFPGIYYNSGCRLKITAIDSIPVSNYYRKRFTYADSTGSISNYLYEGIGWSTGLFPNTDPCPDVSTLTVYNLTCYGLNDTAWYPTHNGAPCTVPNFTIGTKELQKNSEEISIYPNPSDGIFSISQNEPNKLVLEIFNVFGELIYKTNTARPRTIIDLSKQPKGIYFVRTTDNKKNVLNKKVLIQ